MPGSPAHTSTTMLRRWEQVGKSCCTDALYRINKSAELKSCSEHSSRRTLQHSLAASTPCDSRAAACSFVKATEDVLTASGPCHTHCGRARWPVSPPKLRAALNLPKTSNAYTNTAAHNCDGCARI